MKTIKLLALTTFLFVSFSSFASAQILKIKDKKIYVYVTNCIKTKKKIRASAFNPKDGAKVFSHTGKIIKYGETSKLKCKGQGKGYCRLNVGVYNGTASSSWTKLKKRKYAKVTLGGGKVKFAISSSKPSCN